MKNKTLTATVVAVAALLAACGSTPQATTLMDQTRVEYRAAQSSPNVATYAQMEMKQASDAMAKAETATTDRESDADIDKLAYLARQKIALTQEVAKRKVAEAEIANAGKQRDQLLLNQRTNEANAAQIRANAAALGAVVAQADAANARQQTALAQDAAVSAQARNAQLEAQLADLAAKKTERGMVITMNDVLFGFDKASLTSNGMAAAQKLATVLQNNPERNVLVEGFTDSTGAAGYNQALSERRAGAVQSALRGMGVAPNRVAIRGYGESFPVAANDTEENRQLNRRVEIVLSDETGRIMPR
ncbi:OmpA family protein [Rhodoferax antarcticus]|uniref:OmpA family protein n=1 Tax=Rhodoferax antarcticus ANT.BR TaxID=1111071 RepID=A0A1Q8YA08_9BURK|nr:OmpA family protein [Rhodoferax antarcticus]APW47023.1 flagellar motor protein MotB [Rhodoferax antarcticus]MCW2311624.1 outer membrane protein OmpA-like peptidoglycan-associated protein [Rhodoferax antarcticus]OLP04886.1 ompA family protein [Rhodoferax antarcticus ANT.BR]